LFIVGSRAFAAPRVARQASCFPMFLEWPHPCCFVHRFVPAVYFATGTGFLDGTSYTEFQALAHFGEHSESQHIHARAHIHTCVFAIHTHPSYLSQHSHPFPLRNIFGCIMSIIIAPHFVPFSTPLLSCPLCLLPSPVLHSHTQIQSRFPSTGPLQIWCGRAVVVQPFLFLFCSAPQVFASSLLCLGRVKGLAFSTAEVRHS